MAQMLCKCGNRLSSVSAPNDIQWRVFSDKEWDEVINMGEIDTLDLPDPKIDVWRCPICERVYVFEQGGNQPIKTYRLE